MITTQTGTVASRWELAAETIAVKIRWFGLLFAFLLANFGDVSHRGFLNTILTLGLIYAIFDTVYSFNGRVFLGKWPLLISAMEAFFIALLCYYHTGLDSPFRYYYLLSIICCAIRYSPRVTYITWAIHSASYVALYFALPVVKQEPMPMILTLVILAWVTWASFAMAHWLRCIGAHFGELNDALQEHQAQLETRIAERTRELQEAQARVLHQEKMAAFGLLAAGIAHEVGNPLASISSLVQILQRRNLGDAVDEKLSLVNGQLNRIQTILRELVDFSRPASNESVRVSLAEILHEALNIAKYYKRTKSRRIETNIPESLPTYFGVRDQLVQVFLNLILNAIDATDPRGEIVLSAGATANEFHVVVQDGGAGIPLEHQGRIFQPYFTTKKHGTGLGLFVTRNIIEQHGGRIAFQSKPGGGTQFTVTLPRTTDQ